MHDGHLHFSGGLPISFIYSRFREFCATQESSRDSSSYINRENYTEQDIANDLQKVWLKDKSHKNTMDAFFSVYSFLQEVTKPKDEREIYEYYVSGTIALIDHQNSLGTKSFDLISGAARNLEILEQRIKGFTKAVHERRNRSQMRITFIRDKTGIVNNFSDDVINFLDRYLTKEKDSSVVSGIDISGSEINIYDSRNLEIFDQLSEFVIFWKKRLPAFDFSMHLGEDLLSNTVEHYYEMFFKVLNSPVNKISHGIALWAPEHLLEGIPHSRAHTKLILEKLALANITLEICPTGNILLTPLKGFEDINISLLEVNGVNYSINTDNPTLFNTNLRNEIELLSHHMRN